MNSSAGVRGNTICGHKAFAAYSISSVINGVSFDTIKYSSVLTMVSKLSCASWRVRGGWDEDNGMAQLKASKQEVLTRMFMELSEL